MLNFFLFFTITESNNRNFLSSFILLNSSLCCPGCAAYIQVCRGLMISAVCLGFLGAILALVGMKCTRIGGSETTKAKITSLAGLHFVLSGNCLDLYYFQTTVLPNKVSRYREPETSMIKG